MHPHKISSWLAHVLILLFAVSFLLALWNFLSISWTFVRLPPQGDAYVFFAVARGLLNGLRLYWDMFEIKPPLFLWLMAFSLKIGQPMLYMYVQIALLLSVAPVLGMFIYRLTKNHVATACALLLGITVAYEIVARTAAYLPEGFGAPLTIFSIVLFAYPSEKYLLRTVVAGIILGIAAMIKEPFVACFVLGSLFFCRSTKDLWRLFAILCVGGATSMLILLLLGSFSGYFLLYLPEMFMGRGVNTVHFPDFNLGVYYFIPASLWMRALNVFKLFTMMAVPAQSFLFSTFFFVCLGLFAPLKTEVRRNTVMFSFLSIAAVIFLAHLLYVLYGMFAALHLSTQTVHMSDLGTMKSLILPAVPIVMGVLQIAALLIIPPAMAFLMYLGKRLWDYRPSKETQLWVLVALAGLFCTAGIVVFGGDYIAQYLGFAIPVLIALALFCLWESTRRGFGMLAMLLTSILILHTFVPGKTRVHLQPYMHWPEVEGELKKAEKIDALLDACNIQQYLLARAVQYYYAFTYHSPYQVFYGHLRAQGALWPDISSSQKANAYLAEKFDQDMKKAKIVLMEPVDDPSAAQVQPRKGPLYPAQAEESPAHSGIPQKLIPILQNEFTLAPPPCAVGLMPIQDVKVYFRRS